jgi:protocatechuate 3,4-dioxygenase beta subunit
VKDINDRFDTTGQRFLRGHQVTDRDGIARFTTIFPGWYRGRTVHIHFMIRTSPGDDIGEEFASQLYFDDGIFRSGGSQLLLDVTEDEGMYRAIFDIGLQDG